jgi:chemotaxis protein CheX
MQEPPAEERHRLVLADTLDLKAAGPLHAQLIASRDEDLVIDASAVRRLGGQCLQVLLAAEAAWSAVDRGFCVAAPSPAFTQAIDLFGVPADSALRKDLAQ